MKQENKAAKRVVMEGEFTLRAKAIQRGEPSKRSQHYRKGRKKNLSRARRRLDKTLSKGE